MKSITKTLKYLTKKYSRQDFIYDKSRSIQRKKENDYLQYKDESVKKRIGRKKYINFYGRLVKC